MLTAKTQSGCILNSGIDITVINTAQRGEFDFITSDAWWSISKIIASTPNARMF